MDVVYQTTKSNTPAILTDGTGIPTNSARIAWHVQNLGTNPLFILLGTGASTTVFHFVLKGSSVADDGTGGSVGQSEGIVFTGPITVAGTSPRYTVLEIAP